MLLCRECGKAIDDGDWFCRSCGAEQNVLPLDFSKTAKLNKIGIERQLLSPRRYFIPLIYFFWCWLIITTLATLVSGGSYSLVQGFSIVGLVGIAITLTFALMAHASNHHRNCIIWFIACLVFSVYIAGLIYLLTMSITVPKRGFRL